MRILVVEDDRELAGYVSRALEEEGNSVSTCFDGRAGLRTAQSSPFDVIVLDVMLPHIDGLEVTRRLRAAAVATPILLLTGRDSPRDIVSGFDAGADDYLTKPFSFEVLLARLRARTRPHTAGGAVLRYADLTANTETHEVWRGYTALNLTPTEFALLDCLMKSAGRIVTRQRLIDTVWGTERDVGNNNLDVFIRLLRTKVDGPGQSRLIQTSRGVGYGLRQEAP
ncbi:MAG TPA: response regulator transcription factor [Bryobacteraceae bacterium]|jgi:DNA-binding response OmpR family regulator|nr:response regulator transcription factor [Bryobacteraceae bacterium]